MDLSRFLQAARQGCVNPLAVAARYGKDSPSPPPAPDYGAAAERQQRSQMSSQYTPYGNQVYSPDASPSGYRSDITLAPLAQQTLDSQLNVSRNLGQLTEGQLGRVNAQYSQPMDLSSVQAVADRSYADQTARLDPQWEQRKRAFDQQMANQGITAGGEAYDNAARDFGQQRNDAYTQARQQATANMPQTYQLANSIYQQPLNQLNAIRTGAQIQNPQFTTQPGAPYLGAAQAQNQYDMGLYNSGVASDNAMMGGLFSLGGAALGAPSGGFLSGLIKSDRRLKSNIERIGTHPLGVGWYAYDIGGERTEGVMADEVLGVRPQAVVRGADGYLMVNYGAL